jgi:hypothetical protein
MKTLFTAAALLALAAPAQADICQQIELHKQIDAKTIQIEQDLALGNDNTRLILSNSAWDRRAIEAGCIPSPNLYF